MLVELHGGYHERASKSRVCCARPESRSAPCLRTKPSPPRAAGFPICHWTKGPNAGIAGLQTHRSLRKLRHAGGEVGDDSPTTSSKSSRPNSHARLPRCRASRASQLGKAVPRVSKYSRAAWKPPAALCAGAIPGFATKMPGRDLRPKGLPAAARRGDIRRAGRGTMGKPLGHSRRVPGSARPEQGLAVDPCGIPGAVAPGPRPVSIGFRARAGQPDSRCCC